MALILHVFWLPINRSNNRAVPYWQFLDSNSYEKVGIRDRNYVIENGIKLKLQKLAHLAIDYYHESQYRHLRDHINHSTSRL